MTIQCHSSPRVLVSSLLPAATNQLPGFCVRCSSITSVRDTQHSNAPATWAQSRPHDTAFTAKALNKQTCCGFNYSVLQFAASGVCRAHYLQLPVGFQPSVHAVCVSVSPLSGTRSTVHTTQFLKPVFQSITTRPPVLHSTDFVTGHHLHTAFRDHSSLMAVIGNQS